MAETIPSVGELAERAEQELRVALDPGGAGDVDLHDGSRNTALVSMQVGLASRVSLYTADRVAAARATTARGDDLDEAGADDLGDVGQRKEAVTSTGVIRLLRGAGRPATSIPVGSRFAVPADGSVPAVVFVAASALAVLANETQVDVPLRADEAGTAGNISSAAAVTKILDALPDTGWSITTPPAGAVFGGGDDRESDDDYKARLTVAGTDDARHRGTRAAILLGALSVPGVRYAQAIEPLNGTIALYVGDPGFALPAALRARVAAELLNWRCLGVPVDLRAYTLTDISVVATVYMTRNLTDYDVEAIRREATNNVLKYMSDRVNADEYYQDMIQGAIGRAHPEVQHVYVASPSGSVIRPADTAYATLPTITRYRLTASNIRITFANPLTT